MFVSYARTDFTRVEPVVAGLREAGMEVWVDVDGIAPGDVFPKEIGDALARADLVVVFLSRVSVTRPWVLKEIAYAEEQQKRVVPIELEPVDLPPELAVQIGTRQRIPVAAALEKLAGLTPQRLSAEPPNLDGYLTHLVDEWGWVPIDALVEDRAARGIRIEDIYVALSTRAPGLGESREPMAAREVEALQDPQKRTPAAIARALKAVGLADRQIARLGLVGRVEARLGDISEPSSDDVLRALTTIDLQDALMDARVVLVEGGPGSGKSTTLQHVAVSLAAALRPTGTDPTAAERMGFAAPYPVPILLPLRRFARWLNDQGVDVCHGGADALKRYVEHAVHDSAQGAGWVGRALSEGRALLLLDGLDEVAHTPLRRGIAKVVRDFAKRFTQCRLAVTSRPTGLGSAERTALGAVGELIHCHVLELDAASARRSCARGTARCARQRSGPTPTPSASSTGWRPSTPATRRTAA